MTSDESRYVVDECRDCGRAYASVLDANEGIVAGLAPVQSVRCSDCGTTNAATKAGCEGLSYDACPWLVDWNDALCTFPEHNGFGPGVPADD